MKSSSRLSRAAAAVLVGLLPVIGCSGRRPPAPTPAPVPPPGAPKRFEPADQDDASRRLVAKAVSAMGGESVVDGVRTLVLTGSIRQRSEGGEYEASVTTTFVYPNRMRRDLVLPTGATVSTIFTREHAYLVGPQGAFEVSPGEKERLEASALMNPLSILKARRHPLFRVAPVGPTGRPGAVEDRADRLEIRIADRKTQVTLDDQGRIVEQLLEAPDSGTTKNPPIRIRYSDFQTTDGLVYPHYSEAFAHSAPLYSLRIDSVGQNVAVPDSLFQVPAAAPDPIPSPTPSRH